ncbi:hypothetical protein BJ170DRAFT_582302 [Xylariales sp. AK1849]|nr:hypothetical protein BJ170DRAFT_582302 [Xylariales sp. AK1849]
MSCTSSPSGMPWSMILVPSFLGYLLLVQLLRFRRERGMRIRYGYPDRASLAKMTVEDAQKIIKDLSTLEFPAFLVTSLQFGLFKTYGVETISKLLLETRNLTDPVASLKRYEDTAVIIGEFMTNPPSSQRALSSIARMNYLHSSFIKSNKISNADLLYTLSVFVTEPGRFCRLYEWRPLNEMEICAYGVFWKWVGELMGIKYDGFLPKATGSSQEINDKDGEQNSKWEDGLDWAQDIVRWAKAYEVEAFRPSVISNKPAQALIPMITYWVPKWGQAFARECVCVLLGDRVREAFMLPEPGVTAASLVYTSLLFRRLFLRYLCLPRFSPLSRHIESSPASTTASQNDSGETRLQTNFPYGNYPFYVRPTLWNRFGVDAWVIWLAGGKVPGDEPEEYMSRGFRFEDLGPRNRMGNGGEEMKGDIERMRKIGSCPFG